jgi:hypothetical protein
MARRSAVFHGDGYLKIQERVKAYLNAQEGFLSVSTAKSPRAAGDAIQEIVSESFQSILGGFSTECSSAFARRAMADIAFTDTNGCYCVVDVKTHRTDTKFNMPNLTSVDRLARFYEDDANYFVILMIRYAVQETRVIVSEVMFVPIEFLAWDCLTIGALGWGQIQIANSNYISVKPEYLRKKWMLELCDVVLDFYPREKAKIDQRISRFQKLRETWAAKPEGG